MKKSAFVILFRWVVPLAFVIIFVFLPDFTYQMPGQSTPVSLICTRVFFAIYLSHPFLSAAEILSKISETRIQNYETYFIKGQKGFTAEGVIAGGLKVLILLIVMFFALQVFPSISTLIRWMISVVYSAIVLRLNWSVYDYIKIEESHSNQTEEQKGSQDILK